MISFVRLMFCHKNAKKGNFINFHVFMLMKSIEINVVCVGFNVGKALLSDYQNFCSAKGHLIIWQVIPSHNFF